MSTFRPNFRVNASQHADPDLDWMQQATKLPLNGILLPRPGESLHFIPAMPLDFLVAILPAKDAIPVLLVAFAKMRMQRVSEISIGATIWKAVGDPNKRVRSRLLRQIERVPESTCSLMIRTGRPALLMAGSKWPTPLKKIG